MCFYVCFYVCTTDVKPYTTRIYPICVGSDKHFEFFEYLARNTRGFGIRIFRDDFLQFDIRNFLDSIKSPFLTFDDPNMENRIFDFSYFGGDPKRASQLTFPFPLPDLYLDRPLVLKCYIECGKSLLGIGLNGVHLMNINKFETKFTESKIVGTIDDSINNDEFPMELILANEELDYWHGDYLFKLNNKIEEMQTVIDNGNPFLRVAITSNDTKYTEKIIDDLAAQTGMYSLFTKMVSFCMSLDSYNGYEKSVREQKTHLQQVTEFLAQKKFPHLVENSSSNISSINNYNNINYSNNNLNNNNYNTNNNNISYNNNNYSNNIVSNRQYDKNLRTMVQSTENSVTMSASASQELLIYANNPNEQFEIGSASGTSVVNGMSLSEYDSKISEMTQDRILFDSRMQRSNNNNNNNNRQMKNSNSQSNGVMIKAHILHNMNPRSSKLASKIEIITGLGLFGIAGAAITFGFIIPEPTNFVLFDDSENNDGFNCGECLVACCSGECEDCCDSLCSLCHR